MLSCLVFQRQKSCPSGTVGIWNETILLVLSLKSSEDSLLTSESMSASHCPLDSLFLRIENVHPSRFFGQVNTEWAEILCSNRGKWMLNEMCE